MKEEFPTLTITKNTPVEEVKKLFTAKHDSKNCCTYDSAIVLPHEVEGMAKHFGMSQEEFTKQYLDEHTRFNTKAFKAKQITLGKPYGKCVFHNEEEGCTLKGKRPLHCHMGNNNPHGEQLMSWFHLKYFVNPKDPHSIREWATHIKTKATIPGGELHELVKDKEELKKIVNYEDLTCNYPPPE